MINRAVLQGRLVRDVELRTTPSGVSVASFTVAWSEKYKETETKCFLSCAAWRSTGEFVSKYFTKGQEIAVSGKLQTREWTDKEGNKRSTIELVVDDVAFCGSKSDGSSRPAGGAVDVHNDDFDNPSRSGESDFKGSAFSELDNGDGDLPF